MAKQSHIGKTNHRPDRNARDSDPRATAISLVAIEMAPTNKSWSPMPAQMRSNETIIELNNAMASVIMNAQKAAFLVIVAGPLIGWLLSYPPGVVNAAANVTVMIRPATTKMTLDIAL